MSTFLVVLASYFIITSIAFLPLHTFVYGLCKIYINFKRIEMYKSTYSSFPFSIYGKFVPQCKVKHCHSLQIDPNNLHQNQPLSCCIQSQHWQEPTSRAPITHSMVHSHMQKNYHPSKSNINRKSSFPLAYSYP